jgi:chromosome segregation ATPase
LRQQLDAAQTAAKEQSERLGQLEAELASLRLAAQSFTDQSTADKESADQAAERLAKVESSLQKSLAELEKVKGERDALANAPAPTAAPAGNSRESEDELLRLRDALASHESERSELEQRVRDGVTSLARATAELEKERRERKRAEQRTTALTTQLQERHEELKQHLESAKHTQDRLSELESQLRAQEESVSRLRADLQKESSDRQLAEDQLQAAGDVKAQLDNYRSLLDESKVAFRQSQEDIEARLQTSQKALKEFEVRFERESAERQRLENAQRALQDQADQTAHELSKAQSQLQVEQLERKKLEGDAAHSRFASLDSARASRTLANSLRRQIRQPVDQLLQSSRKLLELELAEEQKALVEGLFENALLVQSSLQDSAPRTEPGTPPPEDAQAAA